MLIPAFKKFGNGQPVIILHGLYGSSDNWVPTARFLMQNFTVYIPDLRNHGKAFHYNSHTYNDLCSDLLNFIESQNISNASIIGHSMGGKAAMLFALKYEQFVKKIIIVDISPRGYTNDVDYLIINNHKKIIKALQSIDLNVIKNRNQAASILQQQLNDYKLVNFLIKNLQWNKNTGYNWLLNINTLQNSLYHILSGIDNKDNDIAKPTLFIKAKYSNYITNIDMPIINKMFSNVQLSIINNSGHWVHAEQPQIFNNIVQNFLLQ